MKKTYDYVVYLNEISKLINSQEPTKESIRLKSIVQRALSDVDEDLKIFSLLKVGASASKKRRIRKNIASIHLKKNILQGIL